MKKVEVGKIEIQNFKGFDFKQFSFKNGRNQIEGKNGSGKTTLSEAIIFTLIGKNVNGLKSSNEPLNHENKIVENYNQKLELTILVDGKPHIIFKEIEAAKNKSLIIDKIKYSKLADFNKAILDLLGVKNYEELLILSNPRFLNQMENKNARQYIISLVKDSKKDNSFLLETEDTSELIISYKSMININLNSGITFNELLISKEAEIKHMDKQIEMKDIQITSKKESLTQISETNQLSDLELETLTQQKKSIYFLIDDLNQSNSLIIEKKRLKETIAVELKRLETNVFAKQKEVEYNKKDILLFENEIIKFKTEFNDLAAKPISDKCPMCNITSDKLKKHFHSKRNSELDRIESKIRISKSNLILKKEWVVKYINAQDSDQIQIRNKQQQLSQMSFGEMKLKDSSELNVELEKVIETIGSYKAITIIKKEIETLIANRKIHKTKLDLLTEQFIFLQRVLKLKAEYFNNIINQKLVTTKIELFKSTKNGKLKEIFTITHKGIPYAQLNNAQQINSGIELINFMQKEKQVETTLFIDNAESVNRLHKFEGQSIELYVTQNELVVK